MAYAILGTPKPAFFDTNGDPLVSGTLEIRDPTTGSLKAYYPTFDDAEAGTNGSSVAITLDSRGEPTTTQVWGQDNVSYRAVLKDSAAATVYTIDDILMPSSLTQANIGSTLWPQTTAESNQSVTPTNYFYEPGNVLRYGAVRDSANNDSAAFQAAIDQATETNGAEVFVPPGDYHITSTIVVTGRDIKIRGTYGSTLQWNGAVTSPCLQFGDGGSTTTFGIVVDGIAIEDETAGTGDKGVGSDPGTVADSTVGLISLYTCHRSRFYNVYLFASSEKASGIGLAITESWILDFFGLRTNNLANGVAAGNDSSGTLAVNFYGTQIENFTNAGVWIPDNGYATRWNFFGGTIENGNLSGNDGTGKGVKIERGDARISLNSMYFEKNHWDIYMSHTGSTEHVVSVRECWFKGDDKDGTGTAHIYHDAAACWLDVQDSVYLDRDGVQVNIATGTYMGHCNASPSTAEVYASGAYTGLAAGDRVYYDQPLLSGHNLYGDRYIFNSSVATPALTFGADDATPSVAGSNIWITNASMSNPVTDFDDAYDGQVITVIAAGAVVFDTTTSSLVGSSGDITLAVDDTIQWVYDDADSKWRLLGWVDASADNSTGA